MAYPAGVQLATLTFQNPGTFLGGEAVTTTMEVVATESVVWKATGESLDNFTETIELGTEETGSLTAPFTDQPGFADQGGNDFTGWALKVTRRSRHGKEARAVSKFWQPLIGQGTVKFENLPSTAVGEPVAVAPVPVTSVAGIVGAVGAEPLAGVLAPFLPDGVTPESVAANLPERLGEGELRATIENTGSPLAADGHKYRWLAGVIRNTGDGNGWQLLPENTNHRPINIESIETIPDGSGGAGIIKVNYPSAVGAPGMTVTFLAVPDETLARHGFITGTSVTQTYTEIRISQSAAMASDYVYYNGSAWVSANGIFTNITFDAGTLTLTHAKIPLAAQYAVNTVPRSAGYVYPVSIGNAPTNETTLKIDVYEDTPEYADMVYFDGATWISHSGVFTGITFAAGVLTLNHTDLPAGTATQKLSITARGNYQASVSSTSSPVTTGKVTIVVRDSAGALVGGASTSMSFYVRHGGGRALATTPNSNMKAYVSHGGGNRQWNPAELDTLKYPASNIWLYGIMGKA